MWMGGDDGRENNRYHLSCWRRSHWSTRPPRQPLSGRTGSGRDREILKTGEDRVGDDGGGGGAADVPCSAR